MIAMSILSPRPLVIKLLAEVESPLFGVKGSLIPNGKFSQQRTSACSMARSCMFPLVLPTPPESRGFHPVPNPASEPLAQHTLLCGF